MSLLAAKGLLHQVLIADACLLLASLALVFRSGAFRKMPFFAVFLGTSFGQFALDLAVMYHRKPLGIPISFACNFLRFGGYTFEVVDAALLFLVIYDIASQLLSSMPGLARMSKLLFGWIGAVALCLAAVPLLGPHMTGASELITLVSQFQEGISILTLCLLLAVALATRPLGLTFGSRIFGTLLGLGILSGASLVSSTWFSVALAQSPYSPVHLIGGFACMTATITWAIYFARTEPARKIKTLPTTSPFFFWNRIAEALGDDPGEVAVGEITPEMFAPAELLAFSSPVRRPVIVAKPAAVVEMPQVVGRR